MYEIYYIPGSLEEALRNLQELAGTGRIIAGGTDLVVALKEKKIKVRGLVDISQVAVLNNIELLGQTLSIGAAVNHHDLARSELIRDKATALAQAARHVGSPQIRRMGTIGGNVVNAHSAGDTAVALVALDAVAEIFGPDGYRAVAVADLYRGIGQSAVDSNREVLARFQIKAHGAGEGSAFARLSLRKALSRPVINVAAYISLHDGQVKEARIVVSPVDYKPLRAVEAEGCLVGTRAASADIVKAAEAAEAVSHPWDSLLLGSSGYRQAMVKVLVQRAVAKAVEQARRAV